MFLFFYSFYFLPLFIITFYYYYLPGYMFKKLTRVYVFGGRIPLHRSLMPRYTETIQRLSRLWIPSSLRCIA